MIGEPAYSLVPGYGLLNGRLGVTLKPAGVQVGIYARNLLNFLKPALVKGELAIDWNDEVFAQSCLTRGGEIRHEATRKTLEGTA